MYTNIYIDISGFYIWSYKQQIEFFSIVILYYVSIICYMLIIEICVS